MSKVMAACNGVERVLFVGQTGDDAGMLEGAFRGRGIDVRRARIAMDAIAVLTEFDPDMVVLHWQHLDMGGAGFLDLMHDAKQSRMPFIAVNAAPMALTPGERNAALTAGADVVFPSHPGREELDAYLAMAARRKTHLEVEQDRLSRVVKRLDDVQSRFDTLDDDLLEARKLQQGLLRDRNISSGRLALSLILRSCGHVGGDLVGHFPINDHAVGFFALDVSGHGVSSALMTARLAGYLPATNPRQNIAIKGAEDSLQPRSPAAALCDLNKLVMEDLETDHYFTMLLGHADPATGRVCFAQAGHPHPVHMRADGQMVFAGTGGLPVGLIPGADFEDTEITLAPGDRLYVLSDGFSEAEKSDGDQIGDDGLMDLLRVSANIATPNLLEALIWDLSKAIGETDFQDDLSGLLIEFSDSPKS